MAVIVHAKNQAANRFYESCGFVALPNHPLVLFMLTRTILAAIQ
mgnify:CR=1 FL=1